MSIFLEILKYTLPAIIVLIASWLTIKQLLKNDQEKRRYEIILKNQEMITPVRLQAYERLTLLLERITPEALIMRLNTPEMKSKQLHSELLNTIRAEFDHNVSQQIYITHQTWEVIKNSRTNVIKLINSTASRINPDAPAYELSKAILEDWVQLERSPINIAHDMLKKEIKLLY